MKWCKEWILDVCTQKLTKINGFWDPVYPKMIQKDLRPIFAKNKRMHL